MQRDSSEKSIVIRDIESSPEENILIDGSSEIDIPFQDDFPTEDSVAQKEQQLETLKERHRHEESKKILDMAAGLVIVALALLVFIWIVALWLSPRQQDFSKIFIEILKTVVMTTIGFICGNRLDK